GGGEGGGVGGASVGERRPGPAAAGAADMVHGGPTTLVFVLRVLCSWVWPARAGRCRRLAPPAGRARAGALRLRGALDPKESYSAVQTGGPVDDKTSGPVERRDGQYLN